MARAGLILDDNTPAVATLISEAQGDIARWQNHLDLLAVSRVAQLEPLRVAHMGPVTGRERIPSIEVHFLRSVAILVMLHLECEVVGGPRIDVEG